MLLGLLIRSPDAVQGTGFIVILPLTFMAGPFVPMQAVPRAIAEGDPVCAFVASARSLTTHMHSSGSFQLDHPELARPRPDPARREDGRRDGARRAADGKIRP